MSGRGPECRAKSAQRRNSDYRRQRNGGRPDAPENQRSKQKGRRGCYPRDGPMQISDGGPCTAFSCFFQAGSRHPHLWRWR